MTAPLVSIGSPIGLANAFKIELIPKLIDFEDPTIGKQRIFDIEAVSDRALIDFAEVDPAEINYDKLKRDCDLMKLALENHRNEIDQALRLVCAGDASTDDIGTVAALLTKVGLTEEAFREQGGGMVGLIIAIAAIMLAAGCDDLATTSGAKRKIPAPEHSAMPDVDGQ